MLAYLISALKHLSLSKCFRWRPKSKVKGVRMRITLLTSAEIDCHYLSNCRPLVALASWFWFRKRPKLSNSTKQQNMLLPFVCGNATEQKPVKFETIHTPTTICFRRLLWTNKKYLRISLLVWAINWQPIKASKSPNSTQSKAHLFQISEICVVNPPAEETSFDDGSKVVSNGVSRPNYDDSKPSNGNELICLDEAEAAAEQLDERQAKSKAFVTPKSRSE